HFAGFVTGRTPPMFVTYLMWKDGVGFRVGTSRTYIEGQPRPIMGPMLRANHERADAVWILTTHDTEADARLAEAVLAARYSLPTLPFVARKNARQRKGTLVGNQALIDRLFRELDTEKAGYALLADQGLRFDEPHHVPGTVTTRADGH